MTAPAVPELPQTLWERAESGGGDTFDRWLTIARGSAYTILAVVGVWGLFTALSSLRRVKLVERTLVDPQTEREAEAQTEAAAEVEEHGRQDGDDMHEHEAVQRSARATRGGVNAPTLPAKRGREGPLFQRSARATRGGVNAPALPVQRGREGPLPVTGREGPLSNDE